MSRNRISRRKFLALTSLGVTGAYVGLQSGLARAMMTSGSMGGMGGGTTVINPPPGAAFADPPAAVNNGLGVCRRHYITGCKTAL